MKDSLHAIWSPAIVIRSSTASNNKRIHSKLPSWDEILHFSFLCFIHQQNRRRNLTNTSWWMISFFSYEKKETFTAFLQWSEVSCVYNRRKDGMDGKYKERKEYHRRGTKKKTWTFWLLPLIFPPWQLTLNWRSQKNMFLN